MSKSSVEEKPVTHPGHKPHETKATAAEAEAPAEAKTAAVSATAAAEEPQVNPLAVPIPPPLGHVPTSINQMLPTYTARGTHFTGPLISGPPPGSTLGMQGTAVLTLALQLDYSMGNFNLPVQLPPGAMLLWLAIAQYQAFTTEPSVSLGRVSGGATILAATALPAAADVTAFVPVTGALPFPFETTPGLLWLNVTGNGANTAGGAMLLLAYALAATPWK